MKVSLPYPDKLLWPNGRGHYFAVSQRKRMHRSWAWAAAKEAGLPTVGDGQIPIKLTVYPKRFGPLPDRDNCVASMKAYLDGIADAIGMNDKHFAAPTVEFSPERLGKFVIEVGLIAPSGGLC